MLQSFTVKDFRCFTELTIAPLARVNLIAGKNNTAKTALLEALQEYDVRSNGPCQLLRSSAVSSEQNDRAFSDLANQSRLQELVALLQLLEPRLSGLTIRLGSNGYTIHGDIGVSRLIPLSLMGEGIGRALSIVLAITVCNGGKVLIDQVETGLHFSVMKNVWKAIGEAAHRSDVQVFATTHSYECIQAAHEAFSKSHGEELRLFRLERINDDIKVFAYDLEVLEYTLEMSHEVR